MNSEQGATRPRAIHAGASIFNGTLDCYILDDGRRVLSQRGMLHALRGPETVGGKDGDLGRAVARLPQRFAHLALEPRIEFTLPNGGVAYGFEGLYFVDLCCAYNDAHFAGELHHKQEKLARQASVFLRALARLSIDVLVDEAYGVVHTPGERTQENRFKDFVRSEASRWERRFDASLVQALAPLWGITYVDGPYPKALHWAFGFIYDLVLGKPLAGAMRKANKNRGRDKHHQYLRGNAQADLRPQLNVVTALAVTSGSRAEWIDRMNRQYRNTPLQVRFA